MAQFAFKNLTVNVAKQATALCIQTQPTCAVACSPIAVGISPVDLTDLCHFDTRPIRTLTRPPTGCGVNYSTSVPTDWLTWQIAQVVQPGELALLREQVEVATQLLEEREVQVRQQFAPQSLEDVELVEERLNEAMEEVRAMRANLEQQ